MYISFVVLLTLTPVLMALTVTTLDGLLDALANSAGPGQHVVNIAGVLVLRAALILNATHTGISLIGGTPDAALLLDSSSPPSSVVRIAGSRSNYNHIAEGHWIHKPISAWLVPGCGRCRNGT